MASNCWYFREPTQIDYRWQLNILAAHGVTGFVWYLIHASSHAKAMNPIDSFGQRSPKFYMLSYEIRAFKEKIAKKLEGYELEKVYHFARQYGEYPAMEEGVDDIIKNVSSFYFKAMVISKFKAKDGSGKYRIMITNNEIGTHNHFNIQFNEPYSKYNTSQYLEDGTAEIIDLFMFLYRDEYYKTDRDPSSQEGSVAEVIIQKNRHGSTGNIKMGWIGTYTKFRTLADEGLEES